MTVASIYVCEVCGGRYSDYEKCRQCEDNHKRPVGIRKAEYLGYPLDRKGYPVSIVVEMDDGKMVEYKR